MLQATPISADSGESQRVQDYVFNRNVHLLGCPVASLTLDETVAEVHKIIAAGRPHQHCVVNAGKMVLMKRDPNLQKIVKSCSLINADGQSVVWALRLLGRPIPQRVTGIDLMQRLLMESHNRRYRVYFLGARRAILDKVIEQVSAQYPGLVVAGCRDGYFDEKQSLGVVKDIADSKANILFVAMGSPKKEYWLSENLCLLNVPLCMGVGGSFDVLAGLVRRAPKWIQDIGMEWFFRFIQEPRRLWRRYIVDNIIFIGLVAAELFHKEPALQASSTEELYDKEIT